MINNMVLILVLIYESICDIKYQRIRHLPLAVAGMAGGIIGLLYEGCTWWQLLMGMLPGAVLLFIGWITRQKIGYGDGMVILAVGIFGGWSGAVCTLWIALVLAGIMGVILVFLKRRGRSDKIAFCPYILLGTVVSLVFGGI